MAKEKQQQKAQQKRRTRTAAPNEKNAIQVQPPVQPPIQVQLVVIGSGPGGYSAAFRAADLGIKVVILERYNTLGGVCLNVGCIPSKALLHKAVIMLEARDMSQCGIKFGKPEIDVKALRKWIEDQVIGKLTTGLSGLTKQRKVTVVTGEAQFTGEHQITVTTPEGKSQIIEFEHAIIAAGSTPVSLPFLPEDPRIFNSTGALKLNQITGNMLVIGGGIIGLEMGTVYNALGCDITVVERLDQLIPGADADIIAPLQKRLKNQFSDIFLKTEVTDVKAKKDGLWVSFKGNNAPKKPVRFDQILVSVGRRPNGKLIGAEKAGIVVDDRGFIQVDAQLRTNIPHIYAIGDIIGEPMLAHKATAQAHLVAEIIEGKKYHFDAKCIPSVAYTDPEVAWVGLTENEAKSKGIDYSKGVFPWAASGRSLSMNRTEGLTKLLIDKATGRIIGGAIVGPHAGDLIAEVALAIETGLDVEDLALTIHPHPTLSETVMLAAEMHLGTATDLISPNRKKKKD